MTLRKLHLLGSPFLRERSVEVAEVDDEARTLVADLLETMRAEEGIGLAANQVGETKRVAVIDTGEDGEIVLINPVVLEQDGRECAEEGCLSVPEIYGDVTRSTRVVVETTTLDGERIRVEARDLRARVVLHEIDHLDGVLFLDHLSPLKRRMLLSKWKKMRKGKPGYLKDVTLARARG